MTGAQTTTVLTRRLSLSVERRNIETSHTKEVHLGQSIGHGEAVEGRKTIVF